MLPSVPELARAPSITVSGTAGELRELFERASAQGGDELLREVGMLHALLAGGAVIAVVAFVASIPRVLGADIRVIAATAGAAGLAYGVVKIWRSRVTFVDKRTGGDVTWVAPFSIGFGVAILGFALEALYTLVPVVPTIASAFAVAAVFAGAQLKGHRANLQIFDLDGTLTPATDVERYVATVEALRARFPFAHARLVLALEGHVPSIMIHDGSSRDVDDVAGWLHRWPSATWEDFLSGVEAETGVPEDVRAVYAMREDEERSKAVYRFIG